MFCKSHKTSEHSGVSVVFFFFQNQQEKVDDIEKNVEEAADNVREGTKSIIQVCDECPLSTTSKNMVTSRSTDCDVQMRWRAVSTQCKFEHQGWNTLMISASHSQASKWKAAVFPVAGALVGGLVGGPVGLVAGLKLGGMAALGGGLVGEWER